MNLWDAKDRIMREDFNADNAKVEETIASLECRKAEYMLLKDITTTADSQQVDIDVSDLDLAAYREIYLRVENVASCTDAMYLYLRVNGSSTDFLGAGYMGASAFAQPYLRLMVEFRLIPAEYLVGYCFNAYLSEEDTLRTTTTPAYKCAFVKSDAITKFSLVSAGDSGDECSLYAGTHVTLVGLKV